MGPLALRYRHLAIAPQAGLFLLCFAIPLATLVATSLARVEDYRTTYALDFQAYTAILSSDLFWTALRGSFYCAAGAALLTCLAALPLSLYLTLHASRRMRTAIAAALLLPLLTNYVVRAYALKLTLANQGVANYAASLVGFGPFPLLYNVPSVMIAYLFYFTAVAVLAQWAGAGRLSVELVRTAADLGAGRRQRLLLIILPLAARGIALQFSIVFAFALSDTIIVQSIGGNSVFTLSSLLLDYFRVNEWTQAAATGVLITFMAVPVLLVSLLLGLKITKDAQWYGVR